MILAVRKLIFQRKHIMEYFILIKILYEKEIKTKLNVQFLCLFNFSKLTKFKSKVF